jgi:hypothetical protein
MNYLTQYVIENQLLYYNIFFRPVYVIKHLLFRSTNHSCGNPYELVSFNRKILFTDYYKETKTVEENLEHYDTSFQEKHIEDAHKNRLSLYKTMYKDKTEQELWQLSLDRYYKNFNRIEILSSELLLNYDYWYEQLVKSTDYFFPFIGYMGSYHLIYNLNDQTDKLLLNLSKLILKVFIDFYNNCIRNEEIISLYKTPHRGESIKDTVGRIQETLKGLHLLQVKLNELN